MKDDYKLKSESEKLEVHVEKEVIETLKKMETFTKIKVDELANTALKRFITQHSDFLPRKS